MLKNQHPIIIAEMAAIGAANTPSPLHRWQGVLHVKSQNIMVNLISAIEFYRDYQEKYADLISISFKLDPVVYDRLMQSNKEELEFSISMVPIKTSFIGSSSSGYYKYERMKAKLYDTKSSQQTMSSELTATINSTGLPVLRDVSLQLYPKRLDIIRTTTYGGNHRRANPVSVLRSLIQDFNKKNKAELSGIDIAPNATTQVFEQLIVPDNTPFYKVPAVINTQSGGIYSTGFSHYIQRGIWNIFSPYDLSRYDSPNNGRRKLTVINVPPTSLNGVEKTWRATDSQIVVMATGETKQLDVTEFMQENMGTAARFADPVAMEKATQNIGGVVRTNPKDFLNEFDGGIRKDGTARVASGTSITSRYRLAYGEIAAMLGTIITFFWQNSNPDVLYPGMPVKFIYFQDGRAIEKRGVLLGSIDRSIPVNRDIAQVVHGYTSYLKLFVER